ncbi:MAG: nucleotidyl transferase AbiEii/AbiGii toxin family protein [Bacteroidales bacterium]|nr:nucleotidyl transferase AbiEii/AbiGii toxin family protein [Bacteroidales bacterium]
MAEKLNVYCKLRLVGGTSLALQLGHRVSVDLDFFGELTADKISILNALNKIGEVITIHFTDNINIFTLNGIKVDIVNYPYPWINSIVKEDNLYLADVKDISAMKLAAIAGRGTKKDFIDVYFLLKQYSLNQLLEFYKQKYADGSVWMVLKSLAYFDDADDELVPRMFVDINWVTIKTTISKALKDYISNV